MALIKFCTFLLRSNQNPRIQSKSSLSEENNVMRYKSTKRYEFFIRSTEIYYFYYFSKGVGFNFGENLKKFPPNLKWSPPRVKISKKGFNYL